MEQISHLWETVKEDRRDKLTSIRQGFGDKEKELDWLSAVITNSSLTGNEKRDFAMFVMKRLTEQQRQIVEAAFDTSGKKVIKEESTQKNVVGVEQETVSSFVRPQLPERQESLSVSAEKRVEQAVLKAIKPFTAPLSILHSTLEPVGILVKEVNNNNNKGPNGLSPILPQQISHAGLPASVGNIFSSSNLLTSSSDKPPSGLLSSDKVIMSGGKVATGSSLDENLLNGRDSILKDAMKVIQGTYNIPKGLAKLFDQGLFKPVESPPSLPYTFQHPLFPQQQVPTQNFAQNLPNLPLDLLNIINQQQQPTQLRAPASNAIGLSERLPERIVSQANSAIQPEKASDLSPIVPQVQIQPENSPPSGPDPFIYSTYAPPPAIQPSPIETQPNPNTANFLPSRIVSVKL
ncbi:hypothetical protein WR25_04353 [Diploscapter pachys]|uniref:Uncharacterized protein n=1 Tax=Diploscapter pachys TaxID=2018661 RepID=A0A2A2LYL3_9BILA|nr:hypothetical protein WR25_04353 [Diploscapter pachys]